jgi:hypothetical protein
MVAKASFALLALMLACLMPVAAYEYTWSADFESPAYSAGGLSGQSNWVLPSVTSGVTMDVTAGQGAGASQGVVQRTGKSCAARDLRALNPRFHTYYRGRVKFWVFDPGYNSGLGLVDGRVGLHSATGNYNAGYMLTAQIQDATTRDPNYWYGQIGFTPVKMDGLSASSGMGYYFTAGSPAPRTWNAWSYVVIAWEFSYLSTGDPSSGGSGVINWYVGQETTPNLTLHIDSSASAWSGFHEVAGIFLGSVYDNARAADYDDIEFAADASNTVLNVSIDQHYNQYDPTNSSPILFQAVFSRDTFGFEASDVEVSGTAGGTKTVDVMALPSGQYRQYLVRVFGVTSPGTVIASIPAGMAQDYTGTPNAASSSADNTVVFDNVVPTVTVNQAEGQADPTCSSPVHFTAVFSEPVSGLAWDDIRIEGTSWATKSVAITGGPTAYDLAVSGMDSGEIITVSVYPSAVYDAAGNQNLASTSTDNTVTYYANLSTPSSVKLLPDTADIGLLNGTVTYQTSGFFYIESEDRSGGIRINSDAAQTIGSRVNVSGIIGTADYERCVAAGTVTEAGSGVVRPLCLPVSAMGGSDWYYDAGTGAGQCGVGGGIGLNNIGLLVTILGQPTYVDSTHFTLTDPGGELLTCVTDWVSHNWDYLAVTGISTIKNESEVLRRQVLVPEQSSIHPLRGGSISGRVVEVQAQNSFATTVESPHPYPNNCDNTWTVSAPGAMALRIHFGDIQLSIGDSLYVTDDAGTVYGVYGSTVVSNAYSVWVLGDSLLLHLRTNAIGANYGFTADSYQTGTTSTPLSVGVTLTPGPDTSTGYSFTGLRPQTYTVTPIPGIYRITPSSRTVVLGQDQLVTGMDFTVN